MLHQVLSAKDDWTGVVLRVMLGVVLSAHGAQKLLGWFGGYGFEGTMQFFTGTRASTRLTGCSPTAALSPKNASGFALGQRRRIR